MHKVSVRYVLEGGERVPHTEDMHLEDEAHNMGLSSFFSVYEGDVEIRCYSDDVVGLLIDGALNLKVMEEYPDPKDNILTTDIKGVKKLLRYSGEDEIQKVEDRFSRDGPHNIYFTVLVFVGKFHFFETMVRSDDGKKWTFRPVFAREGTREIPPRHLKKKGITLCEALSSSPARIGQLFPAFWKEFDRKMVKSPRYSPLTARERVEI